MVDEEPTSPTDKTAEKRKTATSRLLEPTLILTRVTAQPHGLITALLLIEIAQTYNVPIGVAGARA